MYTQEVKGQPDLVSEPPLIIDDKINDRYTEDTLSATIELEKEPSNDELLGPSKASIDSLGPPKPLNEHIDSLGPPKPLNEHIDSLGPPKPLNEHIDSLGPPKPLNEDIDAAILDMGGAPLVDEYVGPTAMTTRDPLSLEGEPPLAAPGTEELESTGSNNTLDLTSYPSDDHPPLPVAAHPENVSLESANSSNSTVLKESVNNTTGSHSNGGSKNGKNDSEAVASTNTAPRDKEKSVFLRLTNQIRELELNMSLFSSYLDQISTG